MRLFLYYNLPIQSGHVCPAESSDNQHSVLNYNASLIEEETLNTLQSSSSPVWTSVSSIVLCFPREWSQIKDDYISLQAIRGVKLPLIGKPPVRCPSQTELD